MQAADIVLVSDDARIADNHVRFGMIPGGGSTQRLPRLVGGNSDGIAAQWRPAVRSRRRPAGIGLPQLPASRVRRRRARFVATMAGRDRSALVAIKQLVGGHTETACGRAWTTSSPRSSNTSEPGATASAFRRRGATHDDHMPRRQSRSTWDGIARLRLNRPEVSNGLNVELLKALHEAILTCHADPKVRVVLLTGEGRNFCAGGDIHTFESKGAELPTTCARRRRGCNWRPRR